MKFTLCSIIAVLILFIGCKDDPTNTSQSQPGTDEMTCTDGISAGAYSCSNIDLLARVSPDSLMGSLSEQNSSILNDIWGWTDPQTGIEYALVGLNDGVTFVNISSPSEPVVVGKLPEKLNSDASEASKSASITSGGFYAQHEKSSWRDFKVFRDHLYIVSDGQPHGLQVFDLTRLRGVANPPVEFSEDARYDDFGNAHNIAINEETGFGYVVGSDTYGGGLHIVDLQTPLNPQFTGFHSDSTVGIDSTGYVHDTQCVVYQGPDTDYEGEEICMNSSETHLVIANVTDKQNTTTISKATYEGNAYAHQGWLTEDHKYFLLDDESDEWQNDSKTSTYIWDVQDLDNPKLIGTHQSELGSIDHNQYVKGNYVYQSNYAAGLRILSLENIASGSLEEVAHFDTFPSHDNPGFDGTWSNYPYFESGVVVTGDRTNGLFILSPNL